MTVALVLAVLKADTHAESRWSNGRAQPSEVFLADFGWIQADGSAVSGGTIVKPYNLRPGFLDRWRVRRAVRAWAKRRHCHLEGHDAATFQRRGTRRSADWAYVAENIRQTREQCRRCGEGLTPWADVEGSRRGFTSYKAPASLSNRVMYEGGDWTTPREVQP